MRLRAIFLFFTVFIAPICLSAEAPVLYKGRFRPVEAYSRLWLYDLYHRETIKPEDRAAFHGNGLDFLWALQFLGSTPWESAPLFWIHYSEIKEALRLNLKRDRFSFHELQKALKDEETSAAFLAPLLTYYYLKSYDDPGNRSKSDAQELKMLAKGLVITRQGDRLVVIKSPPFFPWEFLRPGSVIAAASEKHQKMADEALNLLAALNQFSSMKEGSPFLFKMLPAKGYETEWMPLSELKQNETNRTLYSDSLYRELQGLYLESGQAVLKWARESFSEAGLEKIRFLRKQIEMKLSEGYASIASKPYTQADGKTLYYPSLMQLKAEKLYYAISWNIYAIGAYLLAFAFLLIGYKKIGMTAFIAAFVLHTVILLTRCYILGRPPVSNMFETVLYVPWIAALLGLFFRKETLLIASSFLGTSFLALIELTNVNSGLENVQAVLDSQYWLIIHVLLVVGSYGVFALGSVLGHLYLFNYAKHKKETEKMQETANNILHSIYLGLALLIPGTLLGGVWAAESWGRFWDFDPKESWAFISACVYLAFIHAYRFRHIGNFGLSLGSVIGMLAISFTWYGVNYILGTGLHSYGFGSGGEKYYYLFLFAEIVCLALIVSFCRKSRLFNRFSDH